MSEKKLKSKQKWCLNAVATLKPFIERKEHITRSTAGKLLKPVTNWQRREVDTLRKQANQIIRGENVSALVYGIFGMTLDHPELRPVRDAFDQAMEDGTRPFTMPKEINIKGCAPSEDGVFFDADFGRRNVLVGDVWVINRQGDYHQPDLLFIEDKHTYVVLRNALGSASMESTAYRCIYPECTFVADVEVVGIEVRRPPLPPVPELRQYPKAYALSKFPIAGDAYQEDDGTAALWDGDCWINIGVCTLPPILDYGPPPINLTWVKDIDTVDELPETAAVGEMYGIRNGRISGADQYYVWTPEHNWCQLMQNTSNEEAVNAARINAFVEQFGLHVEADLVNKLTSGELFKTKRTNPRYTVWVADEHVSSILDSIYQRAYGHTNFTTYDGDIYFRHLDKWCQSPYWFGSVEGNPGIHHGSVAHYDVTPYTSRLPQFKPYELIQELEAAGDLQPGDAYLNQADHIIVWANNEWTDMGKFNHDIGYIRCSEGGVYPKSRNDIMADYLGCKLSDPQFVHDWTELPENPTKGDYCLMHSSPVTEMRETVFDGEVWIEMEEPYHPIAIPEYVVMGERPVEETPKETDPNWTFEEPKPNPTGFWSRLGRMLGFK